MGKSGGGTAAGALAGQYAKQLAKLSGPSRKLYFGQLKEALTQGTLTERTPIIQQMVEGGLRQGSTALEAARGGIAKLGSDAARSPAAQEQLTGLRSQAQQAVASIPSEVVQQAALRAPSETTSVLQQVNSLLGTASSAQGAANQQAAASQAGAVSAAGAGVGVAISIIAAI